MELWQTNTHSSGAAEEEETEKEQPETQEDQPVALRPGNSVRKEGTTVKGCRGYSKVL